MHEVRGLTVSPASSARVATLQGTQEALPVTGHQDWTGQEETFNQTGFALSWPACPGQQYPCCQGSFPLSYFVSAPAELSSPA